MKKIIITLPYFKSPEDSNITGGLISNYHLVRALSENFDVTLMCPKCNSTDKYPGRVRQIVHLDCRTTKGLRGRLILNNENKSKLKNLISGKIKDYFIVGTTATLPSVYSICNGFGVSHAIVCRAYEDFIFGDWNPDVVSNFKTFVKKFVDRSYTRKCYETASMILTNSIWMRSAIARSFPQAKDADVIYPPLDICCHEPSSKKELNIIGFIDRGMVKGLETVFKIAERLPDFLFYIYGEINNNIFKAAPSNVVYKGWTRREIIFKEIDMLLAPSIWPEPFGRVAMESLMYNIPVVACSTGGFPEIINDKHFLVQNHAISEWVTKIKHISEDYLDIVTSIKSKRQKLLHRFSIEKHDQFLVKTFRDFMR